MDGIRNIDGGFLFADLVVFRENPLEAVRNTGRPELVFIEGRLAFRKETA